MAKPDMKEEFKLEKEEYSEIDKEWQWTYRINLVFNKKATQKITIIDHPWKKKGRKKITKELILDIFRAKVNGGILTPEPKKNPNWKREHFVLKRLSFKSRKYKLVFWFKDGTDNHLWVKNCHEQN